MDSDSLTCLICVEKYDDLEHEPNVVRGCGHTLCKKCIFQMLERNPKIFECPLCKNEIKITKANRDKFYIKNYALAQLLLEKGGNFDIEPILNGNTKSCMQHKCPIDLICIDCKCELCYKCAFINFHKGHKVEMLDMFYESIDEKAKDIRIWKKKAIEHNEMIKHYAQIEEQNLLMLGDSITRQAFAKLMEIINAYFIQTQAVVKNLLDKQKYGLDELLIDENLLKNLDRKSNNWVFHRSLENALELEKMEIKELKSKIEHHYAQNQTKIMLDKMQEKYFSKLFEELNTTIKEMSNIINQREQFIPDLLKSCRYTKKTKDILIKFDHPKRFDLKNLTKTNFKEILETSKKLVLDLTDYSMDESLNKQFVYGFRVPNQIRSISIKCPGAYANDNFFGVLKSVPVLFDVKVLTLDLICCKNFGITEIKRLSESLRLMKLRKLTLSIMETSMLDEKSVEELGSAISTMNKLVSLVLCLDHSSSLNDAAFGFISQSLERLEHLNHLKISFHSCPFITNSGVSSFLRVLKGLKQLNNIELNFALTGINNKAALDIIQTICKFKDIISIDLDFTNCDIQVETIKEFGIAVLELLKLEKFIFTIANSSPEAKSSLEFLNNHLNKLPVLKPTCLDISEGVIDHKIYELIQEDEPQKEETKVPTNKVPDDDDNVDEEELLGELSEFMSDVGTEEREMLRHNLSQASEYFDAQGTLPINSEASRDHGNMIIKQENLLKPESINENNTDNMNRKKESENSKNKKKNKPVFDGVIVLE